MNPAASIIAPHAEHGAAPQIQHVYVKRIDQYERGGSWSRFPAIFIPVPQLLPIGQGASPRVGAGGEETKQSYQHGEGNAA